MAIVDVNVPMTSARLGQTLERLQEAYPLLKTEILTTTAFGRPVWKVTIGDGPRKVLYSGAHHGNEWITATLLLKFMEDLAQAVQENGTIFGVPARNIVKYGTIVCVPMVDPDGVDVATGAIQTGTLEYEQARSLSDNYPSVRFPEGWKANLLGVDLNLQYPAGWLRAREIKFSQGYTRPGPRDYVGRSPLSQRETIAMAELTEEVDPVLVLAFHSQGKVIYWKYEDYDVPGARDLAEEFARLSGYTLSDPPYASTYAGYKDWFIQNFRRPGFTVEVGRGQNPLPLSQFGEIYRDNLGILVTAALGLPGGV